MSRLEYSDAALNALNRFYRVDVVVLVEGSEDIPFWNHMFSKFSCKKTHVRSVGGKPKLKKYCDKIIAGDIEVIVAQDRDYAFVDDVQDNTRILNTYGYSIENTLISGETLSKVVLSLSHSDGPEANQSEECEEWLSRFCSDFEVLIYMDIENQRNSTGCLVLGENCARFMLSIDPTTVCSRTVRNHIYNVSVELNEDMLNEINTIVERSGLNLKDVIRGHFLFSGVQKYVVATVSKLRKKISLSNDALFSSLFLAFQASFGERHPEYAHYAQQIGKIDDEIVSRENPSLGTLNAKNETEQSNEAVT